MGGFVSWTGVVIIPGTRVVGVPWIIGGWQIRAWGNLGTGGLCGDGKVPAFPFWETEGQLDATYISELQRRYRTALGRGVVPPAPQRIQVR
ncbi:hypothetical protein TNIN_439271 [Trichonephila inaurata madagascariensis]|uniref:Uncharacterized protein n=1 Tax=Trichonephila inaurata madagascariensis TaxID=2747483 RepID=A0A8X6YLZ2_9ARAC|nr:hypothetical protein TNIN_439271 [Trichonephila inaurata madagascariensis]